MSLSLIETIKKIIKFADKKIDLKKFIKFGITGFINTGIDWLAFAFMCEILKTDVKFAQTAAQAIAVAASYIINKNWTFKDNKKHSKSKSRSSLKLFKFLIVQGASICLGYAGMSIFHDNLGIDKYLCKIIIACVTIIINYFGNKLFVFK